MIYKVSGCVVERLIDSVCIALLGGITLIVSVPRNTHFTIGDSVELFTVLSWNQEQGPTLFGFFTIHEKKMFEILLQCQGIGPKAALAALNTLSCQDLYFAIISQNIELLQKIPGIGQKKAELLLIELKSLFKKHKIEESIMINDNNPEDNLQVYAAANNGNLFKDCMDALMQLGYQPIAINKALKTIQDQEKSSCKKIHSLQELLHSTLQIL